MADRIDPYRALQVDPEADDEIVKAAYRRLARMFHPDVAPGPEAAARMAAINAAWELLGDPASRRAYDRSRGIRTYAEAVSQQAPPAGPTGATPAPSTPRPPDPVAAPPAAAGAPPGKPSGSTLNFGRYAGWSLGEIGRTDLEYIEWLDRTPIGRPYREEIDAILRKAGRRTSEAVEGTERRGLYRRR